ncbi:MAG: DNA-binding response regulator [Chloroflexota bacterium]|nr:MAG: DNA-binding response regulator [Chloroflexota bacterium]
MVTSTSKKILIVDDDLDTVGLLRLVLQRAGYRVSTATSWEDIVDRLRLADHENDPIDLVILDIMMPTRSGFDVMLTLQVVLRPMPPVIFLSAKCTIDDMVKASDMGAAKYLVKPTTPDKLIGAVKSVLEQNHR